MNKSQSHILNQPSPLNRSLLDRHIEDFLEYLEIERNCSQLTIRNYRHYLERFSFWMKANFPNLKLYDLDLENIKKYRVFLARFVNKQGLPLKRITQNYHLIALRSLFKFLVKANPWLKTKL